MVETRRNGEMRDITNANLIFLKGFLFLLCGVSATVLLILENLDVRFIFLLSVAIFSFARFYYFAFYVISHYVDSEYKFSGLGSFLLYVIRRKNRKP